MPYRPARDVAANHLRIVSMIVCALLPVALMNAAGGVLTNVYVDCSVSGGDVVGGNVCFALKEKVRASVGFRLVEHPPKVGIGVHLISLDPDANSELAGSQSSVAVAFTTYTGTGSLEYYETGFIMDVGAGRVRGMATSVLSQVDEVEESEHDFLATQRALSRAAGVN